GPMTNIAMAMRQAPEIKDMISGIYAISGAFGLNKYSFANATGDTPQSEWNVYVDPEAAEIVYNSGVELVAVGLDVA
ncbi:nucleoside hydrolase, partial [Vallitalea maricola]|uniref:nucleoside hydrolase n=1 Tax=Vallitalea maricola TaxID=3074433 RepID=UPI0030DAEAD1